MMKVIHCYGAISKGHTRRKSEDFLSSEDNISDGTIVQVTVRHIQDNRIFCTFDSGLKAIVMPHNYSDDGFDLESLHLHEGVVLTGKIGIYFNFW